MGRDDPCHRAVQSEPCTNVDKGASGALFGIVATGTDDSNTKLYFNDDNDNNLQVLEK